MIEKQTDLGDPPLKVCPLSASTDFPTVAPGFETPAPFGRENETPAPTDLKETPSPTEGEETPVPTEEEKTPSPTTMAEPSAPTCPPVLSTGGKRGAGRESAQKKTRKSDGRMTKIKKAKSSRGRHLSKQRPHTRELRTGMTPRPAEDPETECPEL